MNIKVLGPGCARCQQLEKATRDVVKELGIDVTIEDVKDMQKIVSYQILSTPALVINEQVMFSGKVPNKAELTQYIVNALDKEDMSKKQ